jgi:hypothetical protein
MRPTPKLQCWSWRVISAAFVLATGCGTPREVRLPVEGNVTMAGKPLSTGVVILYPDVEQGNASKHEPRAKIEADGSFRASTGLQPGATAGWYKVAVISTNDAEARTDYSLPRSLIPKGYGDKEKSGLALEVRKDAPPGAYDVDLDPTFAK